MNIIVKSLCLLTLFVPSIVYGGEKKDNKTSEEANQKSWVKIYYNENGFSRINAHPLDEVDSIEYKTAVLPGSSSPVQTINVSAQGFDMFTLPVDSITSMTLGNNIPTVYITTDPYVEEITSKTEYTDAEFKYIPYGDGSDAVVSEVSIRGRGNTSWQYLKKPYRLKFGKKQSIGNLNKAKNFVLLSNYIDNTLMRNAVAMKIAELIGLPYTNIIQPVNLVFNGKQRGNYMLTNKVGINAGSVDIDETEGILWELDNNMDEDFVFRSEPFNIPCMVKDPDFYEITDGSPEAVEEVWNYWREDLTNAFKAVERGDWRDVFDEEQFIKYFIVQDLVLNGEIEFPKSMYVYKENKDGKYMLGPCWDYDRSFDYHLSIDRGVLYRNCGSWEFLSKIFEEQEFITKFRAEFDKFCTDHLDEVIAFIDEYAALIRDSAMADALIWPEEHFNTGAEHSERNTNRFDHNVEELKDWILRRIEIVRSKPNCALY